MTTFCLVLAVAVLIVEPNDVCASHTGQVIVKIEVTSDVVVTWDGAGDQITQCALLMAVEGSEEMSILLLPSSGSVRFVNLTEGLAHSFQCTCFDQSGAVFRSATISAVPGLPSSLFPSTNVQVPNGLVKQISTDSVTRPVFGALGGSMLILIIYGLWKLWLEDQRLRHILRFPHLMQAFLHEMFRNQGRR